MAQKPPDVTPEIAQSDLTEEQLQHYLCLLYTSDAADE